MWVPTPRVLKKNTSGGSTPPGPMPSGPTWASVGCRREGRAWFLCPGDDMAQMVRGGAGLYRNPRNPTGGGGSDPRPPPPTSWVGGPLPHQAFSSGGLRDSAPVRITSGNLENRLFGSRHCRTTAQFVITGDAWRCLALSCDSPKGWMEACVSAHKFLPPPRGREFFVTS